MVKEMRKVIRASWIVNIKNEVRWGAVQDLCAWSLLQSVKGLRESVYGFEPREMKHTFSSSHI